MAENKDYSQTRYAYNPKRKIVWEEVSRYLTRAYRLPRGSVLELGCGYGDWIGNMPADQKTAVEYNPNLADYAQREYGLTVHREDVGTFLPAMARNSYDMVLASNFFEHFEPDAVAGLLRAILLLLRPGGALVVIQPNFRYCARHYFDDFTHRSIHSHVSFRDLLISEGFSVLGCEPRFLPFSFKSRLPVSRALVRAYLYSPIKPLGAQFLVCAQAATKAEIQ